MLPPRDRPCPPRADRLYVGDYYESKPLREKSTRTLAYGNTYGKIDG